MKQSIKTESHVLGRQREKRCNGKRKREREWEREKERGTDKRIFFLVFSAVLTYWFADFISTAAHLVWDPFLEFTTKWRPQTLAVSLLPYLVSNCLSLLRRVQLPPNFQTWVVTYFCLVSKGGHTQFCWFHTSTEDIGSLLFSSQFNYRGNSPVTGWPTMSALAWLTQTSVLPCGQPEQQSPLFGRLSFFVLTITRPGHLVNIICFFLCFIAYQPL